MTPSDTITRGGLLLPASYRDPNMVRLPDGRQIAKPADADYTREQELTKRQEKLFSIFCNLGPTEEAQGRALSIKRQVAKLEAEKHPALQQWNLPSMPAEIRRRVSNYGREV